MFLLGGLCPGGSLSMGVSVQEGDGDPLPPPNQKSGRYASYYLLQMISNCDTVNFIQEFFSWNFRHNNNSDLFCLRQPWLLLTFSNWNRFGIALVYKLSRGSHESTTVANFSTVMEICPQYEISLRATNPATVDKFPWLLKSLRLWIPDFYTIITVLITV